MKLIRLLNLILCVAFVQFLSGQAPADGQLIPANLVEASITQGANFEQVSLFTTQKTPVAQRRQLSTVLEKGFVLKPDFNAFKAMLKTAPDNLEFTLPATSSTSYTLQLVKVDITVPGLKVKTSSLGEFDLGSGQHYRGIIKGQKNSLVAISVFEDEVMGFFSPEGVRGNYVIGKLKQNTIGEHIVYNEVDLKTSKAFGCYTESDGKGYSAKDLLPSPPTKALSDCVRVYVEVNFNTYQQNGSSVSATTNYINGLFNQSITLYANENINMVVSDIFIWTSTSPYSGGSSTMRTQFQNQISSMNGDIGHLISYISSGAGGIAAGFSGICNSNIDQSLCVTQTSTSYNTVPTYSRSVKVVTHEMGHLLGSRHTHACVWNGNNTAIDGCALATEGSCSVPSIPAGFEGTIMSYCDSRGTAPINFNLGFGSQPGNVIRNSVTNGSCLSPCGPVGGCTSTVSSFPYSNNFESNLGWTNASGDDFDWTRRSGTTPSSGTGPSGAAQGSWYAYMEVSSPNYPTKTAILSSPCFDLSGVSSPEITFQYHMLGGTTGNPGTLLLEASTDGSSWGVIWSRSGNQGANWLAGTASLNTYTNETELRLRFRGTSGSSWQGDMCVDDIGVSSAAPPNCDGPSALSVSGIGTNSATLNWNASSSANSYTVQFRISGTSTWSTASSSVTGTSYTLNGFLSAGTTYNWRVQSNCTGATSPFALGPNFTTSPLPCNPPTGLSASGITTNSASLSWSAASGASNYDLQYRVNGTSGWTTISNISGTSTTVSGLASNTTYNWQVRTSCGSTNSAYTSGSNFTTQTSSAGCSSTVASFPYSNTFESSLGWSNASGDDFDWTRRSGSTPSSGTGPSAAAQGSFYAYMEVSSPNYPSKTAILNSPCFNLSGVSSPELNFQYHMLGGTTGNPGTLLLEASTNGSTWSTIWSRNGNQGSAWNAANVDLGSYSSATALRLRFRGTSGSSWQGDMCVDDIQLGAAASCPVIDFNSNAPISYGGGQDQGLVTVQGGGAELYLRNNAWKAIDLNYTVTSSTVIEFEFRSTIEGEIHGIGFDNDNGISSNFTFKVHGTQNWGITNYDNYSGTAWTSYTIPVGSFYTGAFTKFFFVADHDGGARNGNAYFRNVKIYEGSCGGNDVSFVVDEIAIGNESEGQIGNFEIAPNPVSDKLNVSFDLAESQNLDLKVMDMAGRTLYQRSLDLQAGSAQEKVNVAKLPAGIYFIQVGDETKRFAVVR